MIPWFANACFGDDGRAPRPLNQFTSSPNGSSLCGVLVVHLVLMQRSELIGLVCQNALSRCRLLECRLRLVDGLFHADQKSARSLSTSGYGEIVLLIGDAGVGKTHIVSKFIASFGSAYGDAACISTNVTTSSKNPRVTIATLSCSGFEKMSGIAAFCSLLRDFFLIRGHLENRQQNPSDRQLRTNGLDFYTANLSNDQKAKLHIFNDEFETDYPAPALPVTQVDNNSKEDLIVQLILAVGSIIPPAAEAPAALMVLDHVEHLEGSGWRIVEKIAQSLSRLQQDPNLAFRQRLLILLSFRPLEFSPTPFGITHPSYTRLCRAAESNNIESTFNDGTFVVVPTSKSSAKSNNMINVVRAIYVTPLPPEESMTLLRRQFASGCLRMRNPDEKKLLSSFITISATLFDEIDKRCLGNPRYIIAYSNYLLTPEDNMTPKTGLPSSSFISMQRSVSREVERWVVSLTSEQLETKPMNGLHATLDIENASAIETALQSSIPEIAASLINAQIGGLTFFDVMVRITDCAAQYM
jgi:PIN domain nuclease of toxin-antitoxin system